MQQSIIEGNLSFTRVADPTLPGPEIFAYFVPDPTYQKPVSSLVTRALYLNICDIFFHIDALTGESAIISSAIINSFTVNDCCFYVWILLKTSDQAMSRVIDPSVYVSWPSKVGLSNLTMTRILQSIELCKSPYL